MLCESITDNRWTSGCGCVLFQPSNTSAQALRVCVYPRLCLSTFPSSRPVACFLILWFSYLEFPDDADAAGLGPSSLSSLSLDVTYLGFSPPHLSPLCLFFVPLIILLYPIIHTLSHCSRILLVPTQLPLTLPPCLCPQWGPEAWLSHLRPLQSCSSFSLLKRTQPP